MSKKLSGILFIVFAGFLVLSTIMYVSAFGFHKPEAVSHAKKDEPKPQQWQFAGPTGTFDRQSAQRGYQVYKQVCAACHSMNLVSFRNLNTLGFSEGEIKSIAADYSYPTIGEDGSTTDRKGIPSDHFKAPFDSKEAAAAANGGAIPPDLSLMAKAREEGPNYIYSLLNGYGKTTDYLCTTFSDKGICTNYRLATDQDRQANVEAEQQRVADAKDAQAKKQPPQTFNKDADKPDAIYHCVPADQLAEDTPQNETTSCNRLPSGKYFNHYFPGQVISMPPPLKDGQVDYEDGTKATVPQMTKDVVNFLEITAEPEMELRKRMGLKVIIFLSILTIFFYVAKVKIWKPIH